MIDEGVHIWLFPIGPKMEVGAKIRKIVSYESGPGHLGLVVTGVMVWLLLR